MIQQTYQCFTIRRRESLDQIGRVVWLHQSYPRATIRFGQHAENFKLTSGCQIQEQIFGLCARQFTKEFETLGCRHVVKLIEVLLELMGV